MKQIYQITSIKFHTKWLLVVVLSQFLFSCGMPKMLKNHLENDDVYGLINDYAQYRKYKPAIKDYISQTHDFNSESYQSIEDYMKEATGDSLEYVFLEVLNKRKEDAIAAAWHAPNDIYSLLQHYNQNQEVKAFIHPIIEQRISKIAQETGYAEGVVQIYRCIKGTDFYANLLPTLEQCIDSFAQTADYPQILRIFRDVKETDFYIGLLPTFKQRIDTIAKATNYPQIKKIYADVRGTDLQEIVVPYYQKRREEYRPIIQKSIDEYCKKELTKLDQCKKRGASGLKAIADTASAYMIKALMNSHIPSSANQVSQLFDNLDRTYNPTFTINDHIRYYVSPLLSDLELMRYNFYAEQVESTIPQTAKVGNVSVSISRVKTKCPSTELVSIGRIQAESSGYETLSELAGAYDTVSDLGFGLPGVWGLLATAAGWFFDYKAEQAREERAKKLKPKIKSMGKKVLSGMENSCQKEYDNAFIEIRQSIIDSQKRLRQEILNNY